MGFVWAASVAGVIGITSQSVSKQMRDFGQYEQGDVVATIQPDSPVYALGHMDRVVLLNANERFSKTRTHGQDDQVFDFPVVSFSQVYWLSSDLQVIQGGIPTWDPTTKSLTWSSGEPPAGTQYSITGVQNVEYFAYDNIPSNRNEQQGTPMPLKVQLRRFDLFGRR